MKLRPGQALDESTGLVMKASTHKVLELLRGRLARRRGVSTAEFAEAGAPRFSARLMELRSLGFVIRSESVSQNAYRYFLRSEPDPGAGAAVPDLPSPRGGASSEAEEEPPHTRPASAVVHLPPTDDGTPALFDLPAPRHCDPDVEWEGAA